MRQLPAFAMPKAVLDALHIMSLAELRRRRMTTREIAQALAQSEAAIGHTLKALVAAGLLRSRRGSAGGFWISAATRATALDIVSALAPIRHFRACAARLGSCRLCEALEASIGTVERALADTVLAGPGADDPPPA